MKLSLFILLYSVSLVQCNEFCKKYPICSQGGSGENLPHHFRIGCTPTSPGWCHPCPAGTETYLVAAGRHAEHCTACPAGKYAGPDGNGCKECASGTVPNKDRSNCNQCGENEYRAPVDIVLDGVKTIQYMCTPFYADVSYGDFNNHSNKAHDTIFHVNDVVSSANKNNCYSLFTLGVIFIYVYCFIFKE